MTCLQISTGDVMVIGSPSIIGRSKPDLIVSSIGSRPFFPPISSLVIHSKSERVSIVNMKGWYEIRAETFSTPRYLINFVHAVGISSPDAIRSLDTLGLPMNPHGRIRAS